MKLRTYFFIKTKLKKNFSQTHQEKEGSNKIRHEKGDIKADNHINTKDHKRLQ